MTGASVANSVAMSRSSDLPVAKSDSSRAVAGATNTRSVR